uniref:Cytochrome P450 n=1 Tax=Timema genevievae TaxID=629358 RepID=A0A7R9K3K9_TIMGE|nr:unnamed protein product [Timema genevievae]
MGLLGLDLTSWGLVVTFILLLLYFVGSRGHNFFSKRNVPYLRPLPILGNMGALVFRRKSFGELLESLYIEFKRHKIGGMFRFNQPIYVLCDPETIKQITVKDFDHFIDRSLPFPVDSEPLFMKSLIGLKGDKWKNMRSTLSPAFTSSKMKNMFLLVDECGHQLSQYLHDVLKKEGGVSLELEMKDLFTRYANDVIATAAFGIQCDSLKDKSNQFYEMGKEATIPSAARSLTFLGYLCAPKLMIMLGIPLLSRPASKFFKGLIDDTLEARQRQNIIRPDMIHLLLQARKGVLKEQDGSKYTSSGDHSTELSDEDIAAQAFLFFLAGFDTTSTLMCFITYLLAVNGGIQDRLQAEIEQVLENAGGKINYEDLHAMKYLDQVVSECLRLYPPAVVVDRECLRTYTIPGTHIILEKGEVVLLPIYAIHRDPENFPDPEVFDPERFSDENKNNIKPFTYLPFGMGPRNCIGMRFALMEVKLALVHLLHNFNLQPTSKTPIPLQITRKSLNMTVDGGFWIGIEPRMKT